MTTNNVDMNCVQISNTMSGFIKDSNVWHLFGENINRFDIGVSPTNSNYTDNSGSICHWCL